MMLPARLAHSPGRIAASSPGTLRKPLSACPNLALRLLLVIFAWGSFSQTALSEDLSVLTTETDRNTARQAVTRDLRRLADEAFEARRKAFEPLQTVGDQKAWQRSRREFFLKQLGGFPERTPLNARVVGKLDRDDFHVEKLIYESQPRHYVTAILYLPKTKPPHPAVLIPSGHSREGKAAGYNQRVGILLARHGIAALAYDPIGQGERNQFLKQDGSPRFRSTTEHTLIGAGCIPLGRNTATFRIWDGIRSIDYLTSRPDIDPKRIGVTGCSGGGTLTSYLMALDERVACAAPSCYLTSFERLIETIGPQDAEQNIAGQIAFGLDHADYVLMRAPKPTLMLVATHDFFDIDGAWDTFRQAKRFYTRVGFPERVELVETDTKHGYPREQREAMLRWMRRWLQNIDEPATEPEFKIFSEEDLRCTPEGQVMLLEGARSVVDLNVERNRRLAAERRQLWRPDNLEQALEKVRQTTGIRRLNELAAPRHKTVGTIQRDGYRIEKLILEREDGIILPALLARPSKPAGKRTLYLHGEGKHADAAPGEIEKLVRAGHLVLAVDLRGVGETGAAGENLWGGNWKETFLAYLLGRSFVAMRAEDTLVAARFLARLENPESPARVDVIAIGSAGPPALHAAALEGRIFGHVTLSGSLQSWSDVVANPAAPGQLVNTIHGSLRVYDLPDLLATLPREKVTIRDALKLPRGAGGTRPSE